MYRLCLHWSLCSQAVYTAAGSGLGEHPAADRLTDLSSYISLFRSAFGGLGASRDVF